MAVKNKYIKCDKYGETISNASLANPNVSNWDVSKVKTMDVMFLRRNTQVPMYLIGMCIKFRKCEMDV